MTSAHRPLPAESVRFRRLIADALWDDHRPRYISADCWIGVCCCCGLSIAVRFAGRAPRATLDCKGGCSEAEVVARIRLQFPEAAAA